MKYLAKSCNKLKSVVNESKFGITGINSMNFSFKPTVTLNKKLSLHLVIECNCCNHGYDSLIVGR